MPQVPLMFLSDSVDAHSGLARITRDLCVQASALPEFRVSSLGRGGRASSKLPWPQYVMTDRDWGESYIEECWMDFAGNERGVLMAIWDPSRLRYLVDGGHKFSNSGRFGRWLYCPVDSTGPCGRLSGVLADTVARFDRIAAYGMWAQGIIQCSTSRTVDWLPHGVNFKAFQPRDRVGARIAMGLGANDLVIGMVATNQTRKDWGTAMCAIDQLRKLRPELKFWVHIDEMVRHWNLHALIQDYGLGDVVKATQMGTMSDVKLSWWYSGCDLTILPSSEGFGYSIVESLACGAPCIHSNYAGGAELVPNKDWLVEPLTYRLDGAYNCLRPVWEVQDWVNAIQGLLERERWSTEECRRGVEHLNWKNLGPVWNRWLKKGIGLEI